MSNRWLTDELNCLPKPLIISTHQSCLHLPHVPADSINLCPSMIEAMDDTLLLSTSLPTLYFLARRADRFQATYGWETEWRKSAIYIYNDPTYIQPNSSHTLNMPSVSYSDPQSDETFTNRVPIITDHTTFLRVPINRPDLQFMHVHDVITNFQFPVLLRRLPLTALRRIVSQQIISKIRPHLSLQPISPSYAASLDHLLSSKIHEYLGFPFRFNTLLLTTPLNLRGFAFPSISHLNDALAVSGLQRDLNHHITPFRQMATITLADWACYINNCINPISHVSLPASSSRNLLGNHTKVPFAWHLAQAVIKCLDLNFVETDMHYLIDGSIGIHHLARISKALLPNHVIIPTRTLTKFEKAGYQTLRDLGDLTLNTPISPFSISFHPCCPHSPICLKDWPLFIQWFQMLPSIITHISHPDTSLLLPRTQRQLLAEANIISLASSNRLYPNATPPNVFASDGSCITTSPNLSATNFAVVGNGNAFTASITSHGLETGILQGEAYGITASSVLACHCNLPAITIPLPHLIKTRPSRSYYRWILDIWKNATDSQQEISLIHCKAHTDNSTIPANLNRLVDHLATQSHHTALPPPTLSPPTFMMDDFTLHSTLHGFVESNIFTFIDSLLATSVSSTLDTYHAPLIPSPLFDNTPPPPYSYLKAVSSFSAVVQLYLRCGQLDTSLSLSRRLPDGSQPWCRFGCHAIEDSHHIFIHCPRFRAFRDSATSSLVSSTRTLLDASTLDTVRKQFILDRAQTLFLDTDTWPSN
ncbi:hypothetical protein CPB84DRAFT_1689179 [Gymnopilus junonius]|uniref:Uncharacterized protein n=1 Tax=Gymnopilus junonius TaxID=109634 RepID=A0A9P5NA20_GYMJU|nr:hypothetical protein CPB84DRAFT_1689179 [Gymnopilus junonius]